MNSFWQSFVDYFTSDVVFALLLLLLLVSTFFNLYLLHKQLSKRRKVSAKQLAELLREFFSNQIQQSQNTARHNQRKHFELKVMRLRYAYLSIEKSCLEKGIDTRSYWDYLHRKLKDLLDIFNQHNANLLIKEIRSKIKQLRQFINGLPESIGKDKLASALDKLEGACVAASDNPARLNKINEKLAKLLFKFTNEFALEGVNLSNADNQFIASSEGSLIRMRSNIDKMKGIAEQSQLDDERPQTASMAALAETCEEMRERIYELETELSNARQKIKTRVVTFDNTTEEHVVKQATEDVRDISDEIIASSEREIGRLRKLVHDKQGIIDELEDTLSTLAKGSTAQSEVKPEDQALAKVLESEMQMLRRNLQESEQCIVLLENELETLKRNRQESASTKRGDLAQEAVEKLSQTIESLRKEVVDYETAWREKDLLLGFVQECLLAQAAEDISLSVYQCLTDMAFHADILVYTAARTLEINPTGSVSSKHKMLIGNMHMGETNLSDQDRRLFFRFRNLGGTVTRDDNRVISARENENLLQLFDITDKMLGHISRETGRNHQRKSLDAVANSAKYITKEVDEGFDRVIADGQGLVREGFTDVQSVLRSAGLTATQIAKLKNIEKNIAEALRANNRIKLQLHKSLLKLIQKIEDMES